MRSIILLIGAFIMLSHISLAQNDDSGNLAYPNNFSVNPKLNNKIRINDSSQSLDITGSFGITITGLFKNSFTELKTNLAIIDNEDVVFEIAGPDFKKPADFSTSDVFSTIKDFSVTVPQSIISNIITTYPNAQFILRYKINYNSNSGILPNVATGWLPQVAFSREYFVHNTKYGFIDDRPRAQITGPDEIEFEGVYAVAHAARFTLEFDDSTFPVATLTNLGSGNYKLTRIDNRSGTAYLVASHQNGSRTVKTINVVASAPIIIGPSEICTEEIYTVQYASSVTLENATGIATLTDLGNGQWKVTKTGGAGEVTLKAYHPLFTATKIIKVGAPFEISGKKAVRPKETHVYTVPNDIGLTNISFNVGGAQIISSTSHSVRVKIFNTGPGGELPIFFIQATATTECGSVTTTLTPDMHPLLD